jgi:hypothetical protein
MINNKDVINFQNETPLLSQQEQEIKNENENTVDNEKKIKMEMKITLLAKMDVGIKMNIFDFWEDASNMEIIGKK